MATTRKLVQSRPDPHGAVNNFLDNLQDGGFWNERCTECGRTFPAPNGEETCPPLSGRLKK